MDRRFNASTALAGLTNLGPEYTDRMLAESLTVNAPGAALVFLAVLIPFLVGYPQFRNRSSGAGRRVGTVTHDRYG